MDSIDVYIGNRLRSKRLKLGYTLAFVAEKFGISLQQIQKYERGDTKLSANILYHFSIIYGVNPDYFFDGYNAKLKNLDNKNNDIISPNRRRSLNILLVEDDPGDELLLRKAVSESENEVNIYCVHDGAKAIEFLKSKRDLAEFPRPDIIMIDLNIPKRDGHEVLKEIKRDRDISEIPIIIISNSVSIKEMRSVYKNQASSYICKSFDYQDFKNNIICMIEYWSNVAVLPSTALQD